jgi:hypothetical protein
MKFWTSLMLIFGFSLPALAGNRYLFDYKNAEIQPKLAKKVEKIKDGTYQLTLDLNQEIRRGQPLTREAVKNTIEGRLGNRFKAKVALDSKHKDQVTVHFKGREESFLKRLSRTRIRHRKSVSLAMKSKGSDTGIRARTAAEGLAATELKVRVLSYKNSQLTALVVDRGNDYQKRVKVGQRLKVTVNDNEWQGKPGSVVVFKAHHKGDAWHADKLRAAR